jgi:tetratricopeptide (TPR) repeat protein
MDLSPWDYWTRSGEPKASTGELVATLERVLAANPDHPGAIHLYIHAVEASKDPDRAVPYADRLTRLVPDAGHLVHMPTHIYQRVGRYHDAAEWNARAAEADEAYLAWCRNGGFYPVAYYPHNVHFLWSAATMEGRSALAIESARKVVSKVSPEIYAKFPPLEAYEPTPLLALARFGRWNEILAEPAPAANLRYSTGMWHYARGLALANTGRLAEAEAARRSLAALAADETLAPQNLGGGTAGELLSIAEAVLAAEIAGKRGVREQQVQLLEAAVKLQDGLPYYEPPGWDYPIRQALGAALLDAGRPADAERVYREDLREFRENGWSLFGLARALELQGKRADAADARKRFEAAWQHADVKLKRSRF